MINNLLIILLCFFTNFVSAQDLILTPVSDLDFKDEIFPRIEKSIHYTDTDAAKYVISGEPYREVTLAFQLPDNLGNDLKGMMPISFSQFNAGYNTEDLSGSATPFDQNQELITNLGSNGKLYVWLGGTIQPFSNQAGTFYSADILLDVFYTGI